MASIEHTGLVAKNTIILEKPADWEDWLYMRQESADKNELWPMVDLELNEEALVELKQLELVKIEIYY